MNESFTQTGGALLDAFNASFPFATLSGTLDELCLSCLGRDLRFPKASIRCLQKHEGIFSTGLRIEHTVDSAPQLVVFWVTAFFWSSEFEKLKARLKALGYEVRD